MTNRILSIEIIKEAKKQAKYEIKENKLYGSDFPLEIKEADGQDVDFIKDNWFYEIKELAEKQYNQKWKKLTIYQQEQAIDEFLDLWINTYNLEIEKYLNKNQEKQLKKLLNLEKKIT